MPQDVPLEAGKTLAFTPDAHKGLDNPPVLRLRAATWREKEHRFFLHRVVGAVSHGEEAVRAETLNGLRALWTEEQAEQFVPWVEQLWEAQDQFALQSRDDPDLKWEFDPEVERAVGELVDKLERTWPPLARMAADVQKYARFEPIVYFAVMVEGWEGIDLKREMDEGYLSIDCAYALREKLIALDAKAGAIPGTSAIQLHVKCMSRMFLDKETEGNSESPSPSETTQPASVPTRTSAKGGKSTASARSRKTRESA